MFIDFFYALRAAGLPVTLKEFLTLLEALRLNVAFGNLDDFYYLARTALVKDEKYFDRYDQVFGQHFKGLETALQDLQRAIPEDWLRKQAEKHLSDEEKRKLQVMGWDKLMETLRQRLEEQKERHQGGNKWIGTGGTSPFGAFGYNPEGIRIGQHQSRHRRAVKVWDQREFRNFDDKVELGTRNIKLALRRLREFARDGAEEVLDLDATIAATARKAGMLDLKMRRELHNSVKVLVLFDVGGSMDDHIRACEELFSAAKAEFKHLEYFYFHNCVYESVWKDNNRRQSQRLDTWDLIHTFGNDYKLIFVGDASMSPYEIAFPGGSVEHMNEESGETWLRRLLEHFKHAVWLNPLSEDYWNHTQSVGMLRQLMAQRMHPLTLGGLDQAMRNLKKTAARA
ncbi:vWA domain-containing protein [Chromobacterium sphagni]|uniref:VWA domain-containing protein n=1 Tax=Chromobacterium sphagni TaxID=1903179 RepID=A0A1S1WUR9_9NEIS|nr:VWA domain-containing protein [Chromobacterium sphagni]OHX10840.1 VWA domain-containing protein [Chromobacterium sphagni]OHX19526.1 VWA domain-containing protein [Chromobacterium sphagni]